MKARSLHLLLPLVGVGLALLVWWGASLQGPRPALAAEDVGGEQDLRPRAVREARRDGPGHRAARVLQPGAGRAAGSCSGAAIGTPLGFLFGVSPLLTRMFDPLMQVMRPISPLAWLPLGLVLFQKSEPAALFAIAVCSMWPTRHQHDDGRPRDPAGLLERREGAAALADDDVPQDHRAGDAAVHVHRLPAQPRHRLAGHRRQRDADRDARRRRVSLAGIQQPDLRAHPAGDPHHRHHRLRARPADGISPKRQAAEPV